jgi:hypothetical protein
MSGELITLEEERLNGHLNTLLNTLLISTTIILIVVNGSIYNFNPRCFYDYT